MAVEHADIVDGNSRELEKLFAAIADLVEEPAEPAVDEGALGTVDVQEAVWD